jgi:hypothetical protein
MKQALIGWTVLLCAGLLVAHVGATSGAITGHAKLADAASSSEALFDRFLAALAAKDPDALHRLRVTEAEYRDIMLPGSVPEGQPLRKPTPDLADFAWGRLNTRSSYYEQYLLQAFGGRHLKVKAVKYDKGEGRYASYAAHRQVRLEVEDENTGEIGELATGSVIEMDGAFKFISYIRD